MLDLIAVAEELDSLIVDKVPACSRVTKYGGTLYTLSPSEKEGQFCGVFVYAGHVQLSFSRGASLADPDQLLQGSGKLRRHINFSAVSECHHPAVVSLITEAAQ